MNSAHTAVLQSDSSAAGQARFADTLWSVVLRAARPGSPPCLEALERLCRTYWPPLYAFVRRQGFPPADAQDLTQEFFARLLAKDYLAGIDRGKGKFRSFLLAALKHFLANEWDRARAQKRGGGCAVVSLDEQDAEGRYLQEPASELTPEMLYEKRWATTLLGQALRRLADDCAREGKTALFEELRPYLSSEATEGAYAVAAARLGMTPGAVAVAVHRLRQRYGVVLKEEIAQTVRDRREVAGELRHLLEVLSR